MLLLVHIPDDPSRDDLKRISRETGVPLPQLVALTAKHDPFTAGSPADERDARWFVDITAGRNVATHLRGVHYRLLHDQQSGYDGDDKKNNGWKRLKRGAAKARDMGLIEPWAFPDKRTRLMLRDGRGDGEPVEYTVVKPTLQLPTVSVLREAKVDGWDGPLTVQPVRVIVLIEKDDDDLLDEILRPCIAAGAELRVTVGFTPKALAARLAQDARRDPRPLVVFTLTDADSSGEQMPVVTGRHLEFLARRYQLPPIFLDRVALTLAQVSEIEAQIGREIPLAPDVAREIGRIELNALPVFAPGWLRGQVKAALDSVTVRVDDPEVELVPEELRDLLERAEALADRLYRERVADRLGEIERIVDETLNDWEPEAVEIEVPEIDLARDWILDPSRDYLEQLNAYRRHGAVHRDTSPLVLEERFCACGCGESIAHLSVQARYLNKQHTDRARRRRSA